MEKDCGSSALNVVNKLGFNMKLSVVLFLFLTIFSFAQNETSPDSLQKNSSPVSEEIAVLDSVMQVRDSLCSIEKDSLRKSLVVEEAKCANWEQSYETMKKDNAVCAQALAVSIEVNEKSKEKADNERKQAAMMSSTSFLGGLGLGMLLFWLIFD